MQKVPTEYNLNLEALSVNRAWQGRRFKTREYNKWIQDGLWLLKSLEAQKKPYKLEIDLYVNALMDIDNPLKPLLDLLKKGGIIEDDRYIESLNVRKFISSDHKIVIRFV